MNERDLHHRLSVFLVDRTYLHHADNDSNMGSPILDARKENCCCCYCCFLCNYFQTIRSSLFEK